MTFTFFTWTCGFRTLFKTNGEYILNQHQVNDLRNEQMFCAKRKWRYTWSIRKNDPYVRADIDRRLWSANCEFIFKQQQNICASKLPLSWTTEDQAVYQGDCRSLELIIFLCIWLWSQQKRFKLLNKLLLFLQSNFTAFFFVNWKTTKSIHLNN
jgi:hypothetical protein